MPVQSWAHSQYWTSQSTVVEPIVPHEGAVGYPMWQSGVIMGSLWGGALAYGAQWWDRLRVLWTLSRRMWTMDDEQRQVVYRCLDVVDSPGYPVARMAVRRCATTLGFNRNEAWAPLKDQLKQDHGQAENTFRHLHTVNLLRQNYLNSTLSNPQAHLLVELAYQGFAIKGR